MIVTNSKGFLMANPDVRVDATNPEKDVARYRIAWDRRWTACDP